MIPYIVNLSNTVVAHLPVLAIKHLTISCGTQNKNFGSECLLSRHINICTCMKTYPTIILLSTYRYIRTAIMFSIPNMYTYTYSVMFIVCILVYTKQILTIMLYNAYWPILYIFIYSELTFAVLVYMTYCR